MTKLAKLLSIIAILGLGACATTQVVTNIDKPTACHDETVDFSTLKTYAWLGGEMKRQYQPDVSDDVLYEKIRDAVALELEQAGLQPAADDAAPSVYVAYHLTAKEREHTDFAPYGWAGGDTSFQRKLGKGTLLVDMIGLAKGAIIWRGSVDAEWDRDKTARVAGDAATTEKAVKQIVAKVFTQYPPKK